MPTGSWSGPIRSRFAQATQILLHGGYRSLRAYACGLLIFAASRLVVFAGVKYGMTFVRVPDPAKWEVGPNWYHQLLRWDAGWYGQIVTNGYFFKDDGLPHTVAFFPLFPLLASAIRSVLGVGEYRALMLVSNVSALVAVLLMIKLFRDERGDKVALLSVAFFCFFPSSLFLSSAYSEALCLMSILLCLILLAHERFVLAAAMAGLSLATRSTSVVIVPVVLLEMWRHNILPLTRFLPRIVLCAVLASSGLLAYMIYLGVEFGHPLAFLTSQGAWQGAWKDQTLATRLTSAVMLAPFLQLHVSSAGFSLCFFGLMIWSFWHLRLALSLYGLGTILMPYLAQGGFTPSSDRFALMCVPAFLCMGILCRDRPWLAGALASIFAVLLFEKTTLFSLWYWEG